VILLAASLVMLVGGAGYLVATLTSPQITLTTTLPYEGLYLEYRFDKYSKIGLQDVIENSSNTIQYAERLDSSTMKLQAKEELFIFDVLVDTDTLRYLSGPHQGKVIGHLINRDLRVGEMMEVLGKIFEVTSRGDEFVFPDGLKVRTLTLTFNQLSERSTGRYNETEVRVYDLNSGLLVWKHDHGFNLTGSQVTYDYVTRLVDPRIDLDGDGLSEYYELISARSDPRRPDSDGDLWGDRFDPAPLNLLMPNLPFTMLATAGVLAFFTFRLVQTED
jgi:hypothetical protein